MPRNDHTCDSQLPVYYLTTPGRVGRCYHVRTVCRDMFEGVSIQFLWAGVSLSLSPSMTFVFLIASDLPGQGLGWSWSVVEKVLLLQYQLCG